MSEQTPVIVGVAQNEQRLSNWEDHKEPLELMHAALCAAAEDSGNPQILDAASAIRVVRGKWPYTNPAGVLRDQLGLSGAETAVTQFGGNYVQTIINQTALDIQAGRHKVVLITGAECGQTQARAKRAGAKLRWEAKGGAPDRVYGEDIPMAHPEELKCKIGAPIQIYAMFENALGHALGQTHEEHMRDVAELWASFSAVAVDNPNAWLRNAHSADDIRTISATNRPVSLPYPKLMNSNNSVDQGAALIMCSTAAARELGIAEDRWVYPWAGTDAHDTYYVSNRDNLYSSPAIRHAGRRVFELAGVSPDELDDVDLYSCFPVAVQVAARELGLTNRVAAGKPLTVTGGLTFAGGPLNNYVMHSVATTVARSRANPASRNLVSANGGFLTKHAFGVYSATPPDKPFQHEDLQPEVDTEPTREVIEDFSGEARTETFTIMFDAEGPSMGHVAGLTADGQRVWGSVHDRDQVVEMHEKALADDLMEAPVRINQQVAAY